MSEVDQTIEAGYTKPISKITVGDKLELMNTMMFHSTLFRSKAVLDQLKEGLCALGVLDALAKYSSIMEELFVGNKRKALTAGKMFYCPCIHCCYFTVMHVDM